jgi:hypothetical protein
MRGVSGAVGWKGQEGKERKNEGTYANENPSSFCSVAAEVLAAPLYSFFFENVPDYSNINCRSGHAGRRANENLRMGVHKKNRGQKRAFIRKARLS